MAVPRCLSRRAGFNGELWLELTGRLKAEEHRMRLNACNEPNVRGTANGPRGDTDEMKIIDYLTLCKEKITPGIPSTTNTRCRRCAWALRSARTARTSLAGATWVRAPPLLIRRPSSALRSQLPCNSHRDDARPPQDRALAGRPDLDFLFHHWLSQNTDAGYCAAV